MHVAIRVSLWVAVLVAPVSARAQGGEEASVWQFGMREADWETIERLQGDIRDYRGAGAIGAYELRIQTNGSRFDAMVTAEIVDASKLAELRGIDPTRATSKGARRPGRAATPTLLSSPLDAPSDDS